MERYLNLSGQSGVVAYEAGNDFILVSFAEGPTYLYTYRSAGKRQIEDMKRLARAGRGLSGYISQHVKDRYAKKLP